MTTKELINQYVTAHADNRWMDASELETLLTEFAEKLQEPSSEDLEKEIDRYFNTEGIPVTGGALRDTARHFAQWQKEQMMKDALEARSIGIHPLEKTVSYEVKYPNEFPSKFKKVKVIIIKE